MQSAISPFVSIVFPNLNGGDFVTKTIDSILNLRYPKERLEIVIVDSNSSDKSPELIKNRYLSHIDSQAIKLIELNKNIGAPAAYNVGIKKAYKKADYILKMDNDVILNKDCLMELVKCAESNSKIGIVGGKIFYFSDRERLHLIGSKLRPFYAGGIGIGKYRLDNKRYNKNLRLDAVNGCMMLVRRSLIDTIGLMDENYFLYFDDLDWSLRAMKKGFKSIYCHSATALHNTSQPSRRFQNKIWLYYAIYNSFYFMKKNYSGLDRFVFFITIHLRIIFYIFAIFFNNKISRQRDLLGVIFNSYFKGMRYLWRKG